MFSLKSSTVGDEDYPASFHGGIPSRTTNSVCSIRGQPGRELAEVTSCVAGGQTESEIMPLADTVAVQDVLGEIAGQLGLRVIEGPAGLP